MVAPPKAWGRPTIATYLSDVVGKLQKDGTVDVVKNRQGLTRQRLNKEDFFKLSDGDILTDGENYYICNGAVTGRIQSEIPHIQNIRRDYSEAEHLWNKCRQEQRGYDYELCNNCHERFKCWTAGRPTYHFIDGDYTQFGLRMQLVVDEISMTSEQMNKAFTELCKAMSKMNGDILNVYGVPKDVLGQAEKEAKEQGI